MLTKTQQEKPLGATHWSTRTLAPVVGLSPATVGRIWRAHGLKPHRVKRFKLSTDPRFVEKLQDQGFRIADLGPYDSLCTAGDNPRADRAGTVGDQTDYRSPGTD